MSSFFVYKLVVQQPVTIIVTHQCLTLIGPLGVRTVYLSKILVAQYSFSYLLLRSVFAYTMPRLAQIAEMRTQVSLLSTHMRGLSRGYSLTLELFRRAWRAAVRLCHLFLKTRYSIVVNYSIPSSVEAVVLQKGKQLYLFGSNWAVLTAFSARLCQDFPRDVYRRYGIGFLGKSVSLKISQKARKAAK